MNRADSFDIMRDIHLPCMEEVGVFEVDGSAPEVALLPNREGTYYRLPPEIASGYYWVYSGGDYAVSVTDFTFKQNFHERCQHPRFVAIRYFDSVRLEEFETGRQFEGPCLEGHVSRTDIWDSVLEASVPVHCVEIMLAPPFYELYLREVYAAEELDIEEAFLSVDGITSFPEIIVLLKQLEAYRGRGASAHLYYRSKVYETVALVVEKSREIMAKRAIEPSQERRDGVERDLEVSHALEHVVEYLDAHALEGVDALALTRLACMGQTKLRMEFKRAFGCTITSYIQRRRMTHAAKMLVESNAPLAQVALAVGYRKTEYFKQLFERYEGCDPATYRRAFTGHR